MSHPTNVVNFDALVGETIESVSYGSRYKPQLGSYGARTLKTKSGKEFIISQCLGEPILSEVKK
jgi:hypothetical protein